MTYIIFVVQETPFREAESHEAIVDMTVMLLTPSQEGNFYPRRQILELGLRPFQRQLRTQASAILPEGVMLMAKALCSASSARDSLLLSPAAEFYERLTCLSPGSCRLLVGVLNSLHHTIVASFSSTYAQGDCPAPCRPCRRIVAGSSREHHF